MSAAGPIFVFGTGRCGSTYVQNLLSERTDAWIWGEHGGLLIPLLQTLRRFENDRSLAGAISRARKPNPGDDWELAWRPSPGIVEFRSRLRGFVERLFDDLPPGKRVWGFKEILYGLHDETPRLLLDLFPEAQSVFCFRAPETTVWSMLKAWTPKLLADHDRTAELRAVTRERIDRWLRSTRYFTALAETNGAQLALFETTDVVPPEAEEALIARLGLQSAPSTRETPARRVNAAGTIAVVPAAHDVVAAEIGARRGDLEKAYTAARVRLASVEDIS